MSRVSNETMGMRSVERAAQNQQARDGERERTVLKSTSREVECFFFGKDLFIGKGNIKGVES
jgi:hypothetical protein